MLQISQPWATFISSVYFESSGAIRWTAIYSLVRSLESNGWRHFGCNNSLLISDGVIQVVLLKRVTQETNNFWEGASTFWRSSGASETTITGFSGHSCNTAATSFQKRIAVCVRFQNWLPMHVQTFDGNSLRRGIH